MLASNNILSPANGSPLASPTQDMVLGLYYISMLRDGAKGEGKIFYNTADLISAWSHDAVDLHAKVKVRINGEMIVTTAGRVLVNEIVPKELGFVNELLDRKSLSELIGGCYKRLGNRQTVLFLERLKDIGFRYATRAGITISIDDIVVPAEKPQLINAAQKAVNQIQKQYKDGIITDGERYNKIIDTWTHTTNNVADAMIETLSHDREGFNPIYMMSISGSRGNKEQIRQLAGMRGLMAKPQKRITGGIGEIIEMPITANFKEGLTVLQYFISTHGARKGLADTALKTADAGYLTRRLVDVAQDVIVTEPDCGTIMGMDIAALKEGEEIIESLSDRILGRVGVDDVIDPQTGETVCKANTLIDEDIATEIEERGVEKVKIRCVLTCEARRGVCALCYGRNLATGKLVDIGEAVGVIAAQSIGEPGTQLTLRTFHVGGTASRIAEQTQKTTNHPGVVQFKNIKTVIDRTGNTIAVGRKGELLIRDEKSERIRARFGVPYGAALKVKEGDAVEKDRIIYEWDPYSDTIIADKAGRLRFVDIKEGVTLREKVDDKTGLRQMVIVDDRDKKLHPHIELIDKGSRVIGNYIVPTGAHIMVHRDAEIKPGDIICRIPKDISKTRDITGGLPRVAELFEVRKPKESAVVSEIDGIVEFGAVTKGMRKINVINDSGDKRAYIVPQGKHLRVYEGDRVEAGDNLTEGPVNPFDILSIKGVNAAQNYLVNEIQEVYRLQGVRINDKHIEVIVRQMLQKVVVEDPGDTKFLEGDIVSKAEFREENERTMKEKGSPATFKPLLLGITKASLTTESFISAASFQETTRVLTEAAVQGKVDYLRGLKENVVMGHLIPAGTGLQRYGEIEVEEDVSEEELLEKEISEDKLAELIEKMKEEVS
jgi:DNA-directed RNA polymerase subunit beta'